MKTLELKRIFTVEIDLKFAMSRFMKCTYSNFYVSSIQYRKTILILPCIYYLPITPHFIFGPFKFITLFSYTVSVGIK